MPAEKEEREMKLGGNFSPFLSLLEKRSDGSWEPRDFHPSREQERERESSELGWLPNPHIEFWVRATLSLSLSLPLSLASSLPPRASWPLVANCCRASLDSSNIRSGSFSLPILILFYSLSFIVSHLVFFTLIEQESEWVLAHLSLPLSLSLSLPGQ